MLNLINDILDISKVEAGKLEIRPENTSVARLVDGLRGMFQALATDKQLAFHATLEASAPALIFTDRQRLEQVIKNLLSNAVKFTEKGSVSLSVASAPNHGIAFTVRDTGIGIAEDQQESIFEAFRQADGTTNRRYGGNRAGLVDLPRPGRFAGRLHQRQQYTGRGQRVHPGVAATIRRSGGTTLSNRCVQWR